MYFTNIGPGHFEYINGTAYSGKIFADDNGVYSNPAKDEQLISKNTTLSNIVEKRIFRDRIIEDNIVIPNTFDQVKFKGSVSSATHWEHKLTQIQENSTYLASMMYMSSPQVLDNEDADILYKGDDDILDWSSVGLSDDHELLDDIHVSSTKLSLTNVKRVYTHKNNISSLETLNVIFGHTDTHVFAISYNRDEEAGTKTAPKLVLYTDSLFNGTPINNINDSTFNGKSMYIVANNMCVTVNVYDIINNVDKSILPTRRIIGGMGDRSSSVDEFTLIT